MRVNRRFLYWGILLAAIGGVLVAADIRAADTATLKDAFHLWPLALVAIGLSLVLRKTRLSLPGLVLAAAVPGVVLGAALAAAPRVIGECVARGEPTGVATAHGTFDGPASVSVRSGCGSLNVKTAPGNGWQLDAGNTSVRTPTVDSSTRSLSIDGTRNEGASFFDAGRDAWDLTLPTSDLDAMSLVVFAGHATVDLPGARIQRLALTVNAAEIAVDASAATVADVSAVINAGLLSIRLPADSDLVGSLRVGAGELQVCTPAGVGLRVTTSGVARQVTVDDLRQSGSDWQSLDYLSAPHRSDLHVNVSFGTVKINPIGGCK